MAIPNKHSYLAFAPLSALIGESLAAQIIMTPGGYTHEQISDALDQIGHLICPYPAKWIETWFWETKAGKSICAAQWILYENEAVSLNRAMKILWGKLAYNRMDKRIKDGWKVYVYPPQMRRANSEIRYYLRQSDLDQYIKDELIAEYKETAEPT